MGEDKAHIIYTDGSCYNGIGSWAYVEIERHSTDEVGTEIRNESGSCPDTTNNRMEMEAIIYAIKSLPAGSKIKIISDSGYCVTGHNNPSYLKKWMHNGWKNSKKQPVENRDLWEQLIVLDMMYDIQFILIPGHSKDKTSIHKPWNDKCDQICREVRESLERRVGLR